MGIKKMHARLDRLPTFAYTRATKEAVTRHAGRSKQRRTIYKATSIYKGKKMMTRRISRNVIDLARWKGECRPRGYPTELRYPEDMLKAVLYSTKPLKRRNRLSQKSKTRTLIRHKNYQLADGKEVCASCASIAETADELCKCTTTPWDTQNTETWRQQNIDLRWLSDDLGIGTYALKPLKKGFILGEYLGELVHAEDPTCSRYLFDIKDEEDKTIACLDAMRIGNWTRFINHSCTSNAEFRVRRVGEEVRHIVEVVRQIREGEEVTIDYGKGYWDALNEKGVWCGCGERKCQYSEEAGKVQMAKAKKTTKKKVR